MQCGQHFYGYIWPSAWLRATLPLEELPWPEHSGNGAKGDAHMLSHFPAESQEPCGFLWTSTHWLEDQNILTLRPTLPSIQQGKGPGLLKI